MSKRAERIVRAEGVELCAEAFGEPGDPALLLIMGGGASMDFWEEELCELLAEGGRFVIRYDQRDTGRSTAYEPGKPGYAFADLAEDPLRILDDFGAERAHIAGMSMGGMIAQLVALDHPERVATLTLISTSPATPGERGLPGMSSEVSAAYEMPAPDLADLEAVIEYGVAVSRAEAAGAEPFDEEGARALWSRVVDRTRRLESTFTNPYHVEEGSRSGPGLADIRAPTLVIHGDEDPVFPVEHGIALAEEIPGTRLLPLAGVGHEVPRRAWAAIAAAILDHTSEIR